MLTLEGVAPLLDEVAKAETSTFFTELSPPPSERFVNFITVTLSPSDNV